MLKILIFRFKVAYHISQSRSIYSAYRKLTFVSYESILQKQKLFFKSFHRFILPNKFFNNLDGHNKKRVRKLGRVLLTNLATKEVAQLEKPGVHRSVIIKIAIFNSIEVERQFIADCQISLSNYSSNFCVVVIFWMQIASPVFLVEKLAKYLFSCETAKLN